MLDGFTFKKNDRGFSEKSFAFMRRTIIPATRYLFRPRIVNPEYLPQTGPCFIYGNHSNYFDPFLINVGMEKEPTAGVMTRDQFHKPIPRIFMDSIGIVPTSKYVPEPGIIRSVMKMIDQNRMIVIFPEGGRRWDGRPKSLIETTLKLFWKMRIPVHPVQLHGSYLGWPRWADHYRKCSMELRFMKPLHASDFDSYEEFAERCKNLIRFDEYNPPEEAHPKKAKKPAAGIERLLYRCPDTGKSGAVFTPDGEHVYCRTSSMNFRMDASSRLIDSHGKRHSIIDFYDQIRSMPMEFINEDLLLAKRGGVLFRVEDDRRVKLGRSVAELHGEYLEIHCGADHQRIPVEDILYTSIEQNHKLTLTTADKALQINLGGHSALQWKHYIQRLKRDEKPVREV
ncbi:lysophospholipid acyltransferase family protein [Rhodohalobacter halophilus]|uniref:lysophospholipid acyltransferase family protein n=1 Tax=Rhodohalobacter halophilus TaxID=1812810 RepID=UPI00083F65DB|nr:lysophospholipid acyltransferase family protein [Rhodohalobacter halophilus]